MGSKKTTQTQTTRPTDPAVEEAAHTAVNLGSKIADRPYTPYEDERVAPLSDNEQQGLALARDGGTAAMDDMQRGSDALGSVQSFDKANLDAYTNPYTDAVARPALASANLAYQTASRQVASRTDGSRGALAQAALSRDFIGKSGDITNAAHSAAFKDAVSAWGSDQNRKMQAAQAWQQAGGQITRMDQASIQNLMLTGGTDRVMRQLTDDTKYKAFVENRDWDVNNLKPLLASLQAPHEKTTTKTITQPGSPWGTALGLVGTAVGAYFGGPMGASLGGSLGSALGGAIDG
jgi:hypothetical protein